MKKLLLSLAAIATVAAAAPAMAQPYDGGGYGGGRGGYDRGGPRNDGDYGNFQRRIERAEYRLQRGIQNGGITRREARVLRGELAQIRMLESRYDNDGYNRWERQQLEVRLDRLERRLSYERRDDDRRDGRWDNNRR
jgi:hypothetical protein